MQKLLEIETMMAQAVGQRAPNGPLLLFLSVVETDFTMDKMPKRLTKLKSKDRLWRIAGKSAYAVKDRLMQPEGEGPLKILDISMPVSPGIPVWPGDSTVEKDKS